MDLLNYIGKFHPIVLHLPIGFLLLAFMMKLYDRWKKTRQFQAAIGFGLFWGMSGSILAAITGYLLSLDGGYDEQLLERHQWLGIGVAALSILLFILYRRHIKIENKFYFPVFGLMTLVLTGAGHFGGSLTHGSDFLSPSAAVKTLKKEIVDMDNAQIYGDLIQPILNKKCVTCHRASKTKGDLILSTIKGLQKGGKSGALFDKEETNKSLMLQRVHLPISEEEHMPPKGKKQLLTEEIDILTWWIQEGADFTTTVKDVPKSEKINAILAKMVVSADDVSNLDIAKVEDRTIQKIRDAGITISRLGQDNPFVEVDLSRKKNINKSTLKKLKPVADQLIWLNLSGTDIKDKDLAYLSNFPHLQDLYLQQTNITDRGLESLRDLDYLAYLNLYETKVTDVGLAVLADLKRLQKLYLWKTAVTSEGVTKFVSQNPKAEVNSGVDDSLFGDAILKAPLIVTKKDLFKDSTVVEINMNLKNVNIYYTLDGTSPDSTSEFYTEPFTIVRSTTVKAMAEKDGWVSSDVATKQITSVKYIPVDIQLKNPPSEKYEANGTSSLIDLKKGSTTFSDGQWLGFEKEHAVATLDLGKSVSISGLTIGALEAARSYIFYPKGIQISISDDGLEYKTIATEKYPTSTDFAPNATSNFTVSFDAQMAQFIRVEIESNLENPSWHSNPGAPCWLFLDEISIE